jgi:hypothetical protein
MSGPRQDGSLEGFGQSTFLCQKEPVNTEGSDRTPNYLRFALEKGEFVCTAELVLGRDHSVVEAEA